MYGGKTVGVVIPAYNEERFIDRVIRTVPEYVDRVYVIDDGSTDQTWDAITKQARELNQRLQFEGPITDGGIQFENRVVPIQHTENRGVGNAIKTGYRRALKDEIDVTVVIGGDGQMDPDMMDGLIEPVVNGTADYSKGNRLLSREFRQNMPRFRVIGNLMLTFLTKIASGYWKTMDPQNGYTAVSKEALERMDLDWVYGGYGYCNDILIQLNAAELRVADVAIPAVYEDEESHINYRTYIPRLSKLLLSGFLWRLKTRYLVTDFHPLVLFYILGAVVCTVSAGMGVLATVQSVLGGGSLFVPLGLSLGLFVVGTICLLFAMVKDMEANEGKELQYFPGTVSTAEETTEAW